MHAELQRSEANRLAMRFPSIAKKAAVAAIALTMISSNASACMWSEGSLHMLTEVSPDDAYGADFIGYVKVYDLPRLIPTDFDPTDIQRRRDDGIPPNMAVELEILESISHPKFAGQRLSVEYLSTSCGPTLKEEQSGFIVGNFEENPNDQQPKSFNPFLWSTKELAEMRKSN